MKILGLIPARGGSKGIPRKNIRRLAGVPLLAHTIGPAKASRFLDRLIVSTDDEEIASVARQFGAEVPFMRPSELAADHTTDLPVFVHALNWLADRDGYRPDIVVHLRPTAPLRRTEHVDGAIQLLLRWPEADSVRSVCPAPQHPLKMWRVEDSWLVPFVPASVFDVAEAHNQPRQRLPEAFVQNGSVDAIRTSTILEQGSMSGTRIRSFVMPEQDSVNIDSPLDWLIAERLLEARVGTR